MLTEICAELRNYFLGCDAREHIHEGEYTISGGNIEPLNFLQEGQYFRIVGSTFNDGVYQYANDATFGLVDEVFRGAVWAMFVPPTFIALATEIEEWTKSEAAKPSQYVSESFGGYSYTKATDANGATLTWESVFKKRLDKYRRINVL